MSEFLRVVRAETIKLATLRLGLWAYLLSTVALTFALDLIIWRTSAEAITLFDLSTNTTPGLAQVIPIGIAYVGAVYGAYIAGSESRGGQLSLTTLSIPRRGLGFCARILIYLALVLAVSSLLLTFRLIAFVFEPFDASTQGSSPGILRPLAFICGISFLGYCLTAALRSMTAGVAIMIGIPAVAAPLVAQTAPHIVMFLPHELGMTAFMPALSRSDLVPPDAAGLIFVAWITGVFALALLIAKRRDIS